MNSLYPGALKEAQCIRSAVLQSLSNICLIEHHNPRARANPPEVMPVILPSSYDPLRHQFHPVLLSFRTSHRPLILTRDHREQFNGKFRKTRILTGVIHSIGDPFALLRCHVCGGENPLCRIDQEEDEDLAVTRFGGILQAEWLDLVLVQVWECDASVGFGDHVADILDTRGVTDKQIVQLTGFGRGQRWVMHLSIS